MDTQDILEQPALRISTNKVKISARAHGDTDAKWQESAQALSQQLSTHRKNDRDSKIDADLTLRQKKTNLESLQRQLNFFRNSENHEEIKGKVNNTEWYKGAYKHSHSLLDEMRTSWSAKKVKLKSDEDIKQEQRAIISKEIKTLQDVGADISNKTIEWLLDDNNLWYINIRGNQVKPPENCDTGIIMEIVSKIKAVGDLERTVYEKYLPTAIQEMIVYLSAQCQTLEQSLVEAVPLPHRTIVWCMPCKESGQDDYIYSGKTPEKTVYIPYSAIHHKLAESNWIMRGYVNNQHNYLVAHMLFVVSTSPHIITPGEKYTGGRAFIDFPIMIALDTKLRPQSFIYKDESRELISQNGKYPLAVQGEHSEAALVNFLKDDATISDMIACIKTKLQLQYNGAKGFKVYAINLFMNSQKNVCSWCEVLLYDLMSDRSEGSFFAKIKSAMNDSYLITSDKSNKPYISITVSANEWYNESKQHYCCPDKPYSSSLIQAARDALDVSSKPPTPLSIDVKQTAGKMILSTSEGWLSNELEDVPSKKIESTTKLPFYSGFRSAAGASNRLGEVLDNENLGLKDSDLEYAPPNYFDGINILILEDVEQSSDEIVVTAEVEDLTLPLSKILLDQNAYIDLVDIIGDSSSDNA